VAPTTRSTSGPTSPVPCPHHTRSPHHTPWSVHTAQTTHAARDQHQTSTVHQHCRAAATPIGIVGEDPPARGLIAHTHAAYRLCEGHMYTRRCGFARSRSRAIPKERASPLPQRLGHPRAGTCLEASTHTAAIAHAKQPWRAGPADVCALHVPVHGRDRTCDAARPDRTCDGSCTGFARHGLSLPAVPDSEVVAG